MWLTSLPRRTKGSGPQQAATINANKEPRNLTKSRKRMISIRLRGNINSFQKLVEFECPNSQCIGSEEHETDDCDVDYEAFPRLEHVQGGFDIVFHDKPRQKTLSMVSHRRNCCNRFREIHSGSFRSGRRVHA